MKKLNLVFQLKNLLLLILVSVCSTVAAQGKFSFDKNKIVALLDSLEQDHDQPNFRAFAGQAFRNLQAEWGDDQVDQGYITLIKLSENHFSINHRIRALVLHQYGIYQYNQDNLDQALVLFEDSKSIRQKVLPEDHSELGHSWFLLGITHYYLDNNEIAIEAFKKAFSIYQENGDCEMIVNSLRRLGDTYDYIEEQELAEAYFELALFNGRRCLDLDNPTLANLYLYTANVFKNNQEAQEKALQYYQAAEQAFKRGGNENRTNYSSALINQGAVFIDLKDYSSALKVLERAQKLKEQLKNTEELDVIYENLGAINRRKGDYQKAFQYYQKALQFRQTEYQAASEEINYAYHNLGQVYQESGDFQQAAKFFQLALGAADRNFTSADFTDNPNLEKLDLTVEYTDLIKDLDFKGKVFFEWYGKEEKIEYLEIALATYQVALDLVHTKRLDFVSEGSKLLWQDKLFPVFEHALEVAFKLELIKPTQARKELIYQWMEQSKSLVLLESLVNLQQEADFKGKDSLSTLVDQYSTQVSKLRRRRIENDAGEKDEIAILQAQINLWETKRELKNRQPTTTEELTEMALPTMAALQKELLEPQQLLVEYFVGSKQIYGLAFDGEKFLVFSSPVTGVAEKITDFRSLLSIPNESLPAFETFQKIAFDLYVQLLAPALQESKIPIEELIIIPDGILSALPFEVLFNHKSTQSKVYYGPDQLPYLINRYAINYAFSLATLVQQVAQKKQNVRYSYIGIAPVFNEISTATPSRQCNQGTLAPLLENVNEVNNIQLALRGKIVSGAAATKNFFLKEGLNAKVLHLATHACVDDLEPAKSKIFFTDDHLYAHELYRLKLKAQMVVLSACETGVGTFQRGEGVRSLARGFAQSGAPSLTLSYWSVSDQSTAEIMTNYYEYLQSGQKKHQALRAAKLAYLESQEQLQRLHPYYWSAFVHFGDVNALDLAQNRIVWWYWLFALVAVLILAFFFRKISP